MAQQQLDIEPPTLGRRGGYEIYPMPMFAGLETDDVESLARWYRDVLGFGVVFQTPGFIHLRRAKYQDLVISAGQRPRASGAMEGFALSFQGGGEVDAIAERVAAAQAVGLAHAEAPADTMWNTRQVRITDPEGRRLVFTDPRFDPEAMKRMQMLFEADGGG